MSKRLRKPVKKGKDFSEKILKILSQSANKAFNYKQIGAKLELDDTESRNQIIKDLKILASQNKIIESEPGKYLVKAESKEYYEGKIDMTGRRTAYFVCADMEEDVFIPTNNLNHALDKDIVKVYVYNRRKGKRPEGEVIEVLERNKTDFVGVIDIQANFAFVSTANPKMYTDIFIPKDKIGEAKQGDVVLVHIEDWPARADSPFGSVIKVLGKPGEHDTEIHAILAEYGLPSEFPIEVETFAQKINTSIEVSEIAKRRDMRDTLTFTIDPKDAKDFDDALSLQKLENGNWEIGVHIADVSHYVRPGTILDDEAYKRATSVYLVDRVVPMLPEVLSNDVCSLRPNEDKFTFSAVFELNDKAEVQNQWFGRTVIHSDRRFTYEEAQERIETKTGELAEEILVLDKLAKILRKNRIKNGAITFDRSEVRFNLDENNEPIGVYFKISKDSNHLIEEFMLLANRKVSEFVSLNRKGETTGNTFVYRVHDDPNPTKLEALREFVGTFGYKMNLANSKKVAESLNNLLRDVKGKGEENMIETLAMRSMSKAVYSTNPIGHYGLGFEYYSHFTSPIRRYPDLIAHRLLQHYLDGGKSPFAAEYEEYCKHCSNMERLASDAERDSIKFMQVKFMEKHVGEVFEGVISGTADFGFWVEIPENGAEGLIKLRDLMDDSYFHEAKTHSIVGMRTGKTYQLGDTIKIKVVKANLVAKQLDFKVVD